MSGSRVALICAHLQIAALLMYGGPTCAKTNSEEVCTLLVLKQQAHAKLRLCEKPWGAAKHMWLREFLPHVVPPCRRTCVVTSQQYTRVGMRAGAFADESAPACP